MFTNRVSTWDYTRAKIDNETKTLILGLIANLDGINPDNDLNISTSGGSAIAELTFSVGASHVVSLETFTTRRPSHELMFLYNRYDGNGTYVQEFTPVFNVSTIAPRSTVSVPHSFTLSQNVANPFNASTRFSLSVSEDSKYQIVIYNITGQRIRKFAGQLKAGTHHFAWDGKNDQGQTVGSGVYFYRATVAGYEETRTMMLLK